MSETVATVRLGARDQQAIYSVTRMRKRNGSCVWERELVALEALDVFPGGGVILSGRKVRRNRHNGGWVVGGAFRAYSKAAHDLREARFVDTLSGNLR